MNWLQTSWGSLDTFYAWLHNSIVLLEASLLVGRFHELVADFLGFVGHFLRLVAHFHCFVGGFPIGWTLS